MTYFDCLGLSRVEKARLFAAAMTSLKIDSPRDWREKMIESNLHAFIYADPAEYATSQRLADEILTAILERGGRVEGFCVSLRDVMALVEPYGGDMQDAINALALLGASPVPANPLLYSNGAGINSVTRLNP